MGLIQHYRDLLQLGYVTKDLERATAFLQKKLGTGDFLVAQYEIPVQFRGQTRDLVMRVALGNTADHQIEVIEPVSGAVEHYCDGIDFDRSIVTFHHVGLVVPGPVEAWNAMVDEVRAGGDDFIVMFGSDENPDFRVRFAYVDTRPYYGHYTEYLWWSVGAKAGNQHVPQLAR